MASVSRRACFATVSTLLAAVSMVVIYSRRRRRKLLLLGSVEGKPQKKFKFVLADNSSSPFVHLPCQDNGSQEGHPYGEVIRALAEHPPPTPPHPEGMPPGMEEPCVWVQTKSQLETLVELLRGEAEIGVDTEQHSTHSFLGFTALMQISTYKTDYLVDAIALHDDMHLLRPIFSNPAIGKVFHGADSDSLWLQRDFHIYIVNLFDTARACDVLAKPQRSLAYLLQTYCGVSTNKLYQRADWRLRPLPAEMVQYACTDAHFLLFIAHCLRSELLQAHPGGYQENADGRKQTDLTAEATRRSNLLCLQLYEKEGVGVSPSTVATSLLSRFYNNQDTSCLSEDGERIWELVKRLCEWRDSLARMEDTSLRSLLSDAAILALAMKRPLTPVSISLTIAAADAVSQASESLSLAGLPSLPSPSPTVRHHMAALCGIMSEFAGKKSEDSVWPWQANFELDGYGFSLLKNMLFFKKNSTLVSLLGFDRGSESGGAREGKREEGIADRKGLGWERKIPKRWRLGNVERARMQFVKKFSCKAPVYHNCRIYAGDGRLLCYCDRKKLDWYVKRGLAEFVEENPPAVRLLFEPKGRPEDENNEFYIQSRTNRCVGCGETSHYLRYRVIPSCYRQHFPEHLKSHRSHDIVLLCVDCHEIAHRAAEQHKRQIAIEFGIPLFARRVVDSGSEIAGRSEVAFVAEREEAGVSPLQLRTAAMALSRHGSTMPIGRRKELEEVVRAYYGGRDIGPEDLRAAFLVGMGPREHRRLSKKKLLFQNLNYQSRDRQVGTADLQIMKNGADILVSSRECDDTQVALHGSSKDLQVFPADVDARQIDVLEGQQGEDEEADELNCAKDTTVDGDKSEEEMTHGEAEELPPCRGIRRATHKESLLGHGPHGGQVVEMLMSKDGDDGIRHFCQRWRTVFVEALKPAFLPPGWDISHSGRREFGDYSVYNPEKRSLKE